MVDSDDNWSDDDKSGEERSASLALSGLNLNSIKERFAAQPPTNSTVNGYKASFGGSTNESRNQKLNNEGEETMNNGYQYGQNGDRNGYRGGGGGGGGGGSCFNCQGFGHQSRDCPEPRKPRTCNQCHQEGHLSRDCPEGGGSSGGFRGSRGGRGGARGRGGGRNCFKCNEEGHMASDCTNEGSNSYSENRSSYRNENSENSYSGGGNRSWSQNNQSSSNYERRGGNACFKCHEEGHRAADCPSGDSNNGNRDSYKNENNENNYSGGSRNERRGGTACFKCNEEGHRASDCPNAGADGGNAGKKGCFKCGESDHMAKECTKTDEELKSMGVEVRPPPVTYVPVEIEEDDLFGQGVTAGNNFSAYSNIPVQVSGSNVPKAISSFDVSGLRSLLLDNCKKANYISPTPIQKSAIPIIMKGRDVMGCAQTGSGKTAAYLLPILHYILVNNVESYAYDKPMKITALVLAPTRELAIQIYNEARKFAAGSILKICIAYGGVSVGHQQRKLEEGCHVLVATPGRLTDFLSKDRLTFEVLKFLVLDEADRMLDLGFSEDVKKVVNHTSTPNKTERQTLMFSATFSTNIQNLAKEFLNDYVFVVIGIVGAANADVKQLVLSVESKDKRETLKQYLNDILAANDKEKILVFVATKRMADFLAAFLSQIEISTTSIHGDRFQNQREEALTEFKTGIRNVLIATAVAARGLDIKGVGYVINHDMPSDIDEYVHRIGRTGRVGNRGNAISFFDPSSDSNLAPELMKILGDAEQEVPDWLLDCSGGGVGGYQGKGNFGARDIRKGHNLVNHEESYSAATALGGPSVNAEEEWDD